MIMTVSCMSLELGFKKCLIQTKAMALAVSTMSIIPKFVDLCVWPIEFSGFSLMSLMAHRQCLFEALKEPGCRGPT